MLAWAFEVTPEGMRRAEVATGMSAPGTSAQGAETFGRYAPVTSWWPEGVIPWARVEGPWRRCWGSATGWPVASGSA